MPPKNIGKLTKSFLILSGDIERDQWHKMNSENVEESCKFRVEFMVFSFCCVNRMMEVFIVSERDSHWNKKMISKENNFLRVGYILLWISPR